MELSALFEEAVANSKSLASKPSNDTLLKLYSLYKQSTQGDVNVDAPANSFDFVAKAKFMAWENLKGISKETAMTEYAQLVAKLKM